MPDDKWGELLALGAFYHAVGPLVARLTHGSDAGQRGACALLSALPLHALRASAGHTPEEVVANLARLTAGTASGIACTAGLPEVEAHLMREVAGRLAGISSADPFGRLFGILCEQASVAYLGTWKTPHLELGWDPLHPRGRAGDGYALSAKTLRSASPTIQVTLQPSAFGPAVWAALPRVLVHELVCHVGACDTSPPNNLSVFTEGLMDWAALYLLPRWCSTQLPELSHLVEAHRARVEMSFAPPGSATAEVRFVGAAVAHKLLEDQLNSGRNVDLDEAPARLTRLALGLNAATAPLEDKDELVRAFSSGRRGAGDSDVMAALLGASSPHLLLP